MGGFELTHAEALTHVDEVFTVTAPVDDHWTLASVSDVETLGDFDTWSVEFTGSDRGPAQGTVTLQHPDLGTIDVFVVAIAAGRFQAVVSQPLRAAR